MRLDRRSYSAGHFLFHLDDKHDVGAAYLKSVEGGMVKSAILEEQAGPEALQFKHLGTVEIDPIQLEIGMALSRPVLDWIAGSWQRKYSRRSGSIIHADFDFRSKIEQWFEDALITETKFPTLDGGARDPAYLGVTIQPERIDTKRGDGHRVTGITGMAQKMWTPSNFRLDINGIDCEHVNRIDAFSVSQRVRPLYLGSQRFPELEPTGVDFSNITVYTAVEHAQDFMRWYEAFVVKGGKESREERDGYLEFLGPDTRTVLFTINLNRLGVHRLTIEKSTANAEQIKRCRIELYMESMSLEYEPQYMR